MKNYEVNWSHMSIDVQIRTYEHMDIYGILDTNIMSKLLLFLVIIFTVYEASERLRYEAAEPMELASLWCLGYPWGPVNYLTIEKNN